MDNQKKQWDDSYNRKDNFVFYPHEEIIRFVSKYIRKRVGFGEFKDIADCSVKPKILDLGCGIGRHIVYAAQMDLDSYGIDLSESAVETAVQWAKNEGITSPENRIKQGDIRKMPWADGYFDYVISHGVLDSMHFAIAQEAVRETARVLTKGGLFYCDVISGDDSTHAREFAGEEFVTTEHEKGTIQSYFNFGKIQQLVGSHFEIAEIALIRRENVLTGGFISRYHVVLRRI